MQANANSMEIERLLGSPDAKLRLGAAKRLAARIADDPSVLPASRETLDRLVGDPAPFVRWNLAIALGETHRPEVVPTLERLARDEHANVRFRVAMALGVLGDVEAALPILGQLAVDTYEIGSHRVVRAFAAMALGRLADARCVGLLASLAKDRDPVVRWHAAVGLGDVRHAGGVSALIELLKDDVPFIRAHAAIALAEIGDLQGVGALENAASDSVPRVAKIVQESIEMLRTTHERS
jgi:HEAT repeat protein